MAISETALELENQSLGANGRPVLGRAYLLLLDQWKSGERDRELALHLMFLAWYLIIEPPHLTGADHTLASSDELAAMFNEVHDWLLPAGAESDDVEALYTAGLPAHMFAWALGDDSLWEARSRSYRARYRLLAPDGIDPAMFDGRGAYGEYFAGQARVVGGY